MNHINGSAPPLWSIIREVEGHEVPLTTRQGLWDDLARELILRLEKTPLPKALEVTMADQKTAERARTGLCRFFNARLGKNTVELFVRKDTGKAYLYVRRGPQWTRPLKSTT